MSTSMMMLGVTVKLFDQWSGGMRGIVQQVDGLAGKLQSLSGAGRGLLANGMIAGGLVMKTVTAFADLEDASTRLKVTMLDKDGLTGAFEQVNALAIKLGNELPGTSADFLNMMATLKQFGITDESILGGVGEATAKIAVLLKQTPAQAAEFAAKLKEATGVADADMLKFMDTIQRVYHQGVSATEMMYAFARSAGALKQVKIQGLEASKEMSALYAILIKTGMSGETVGTGMGSIINALMDTKKIREANDLLKQKGFKPLEFLDKKGNFLGVKNMVDQFEKLKALNPAQLSYILKHIFGGGQDQQMVATLVNNGVEGYKKMVADLEKQAALRERVDKILGTLKSMWDAASGNFVNMMASFGEAMGDDLKAVVKYFGDLCSAINDFVKQNPVLAQWLGRIALGLSALAVVGGAALIALTGFGTLITLAAPAVTALATAFGVLGTAIRIVGLIFMGNPITLAIYAIVAALVVAAKLIYDNWGSIKAFFVDMWEGVKTAFASAIEWIGEKLRAFADLLPEWVKKYTLPGMAVNFMAEKFAQERPTRPEAAGPNAPNAQANKLNGRVEIEVKGQVESIRATSDNPNIPIDAGYTMMMP